MPKTIPLQLPTPLAFLAPVVVHDLVRVGDANDGGYVIPESLIPETDCLVSLGVSTNWTFDAHMKRLNPRLRIHAYDHTVSSMLLWRQTLNGVAKLVVGKLKVSELRQRAARILSYRKFFSNDVTHFPERIHNRVDLPFDVTLPQVFARAQSERIFLKIDIEGGEYRIIDEILANAENIVGMVVEFHDTEPLRPVFLEAIRKLETRFRIVHLHANNYDGVARDGLPEALEITFTNAAVNLPQFDRRHSLPVSGVDAPNTVDKPDYQIHFCV